MNIANILLNSRQPFYPHISLSRQGTGKVGGTVHRARQEPPYGTWVYCFEISEPFVQIFPLEWSHLQVCTRASSVFSASGTGYMLGGSLKFSALCLLRCNSPLSFSLLPILALFVWRRPAVNIALGAVDGPRHVPVCQLLHIGGTGREHDVIRSLCATKKPAFTRKKKLL
ncbi:hypothetical protein EJ05DRAFT_210410 [Pseudovirgaria hyperparasitica]|uniref:Uncharacterized protein n=1 Tax=Pseudovirgaria hyperparasitica TaxID=470096 RepID=A0A6A6VUK4_9PEZI|nr:uncharacterized protein EJ05DRAFT_210410 [Pseudovirgaria hyperparasitica]KAF2753300.1 hypothetical protein EJ05DRAFT_210410 [Pseudovirgaria hyperparasitica]